MTFQDAPDIEHYLLRHGGWIPAETLVEEFGLGDERVLRAHGKQPGLCSAFAISGPQGFRHVRTATKDEFDSFCERMRSHGIAELVRVKNLRRRRAALILSPSSPRTLADSGETILPPCEPQFAEDVRSAGSDGSDRSEARE